MLAILKCDEIAKTIAKMKKEVTLNKRNNKVRRYNSCEYWCLTLYKIHNATIVGETDESTVIVSEF